MRFADVLMSAAVAYGGGGPPGPAVELFPDPEITSVADDVDGWNIVGPNISNAEPGLAFMGAGSADTAFLVGANATSFDAAVADNSTKSVTITPSGLLPTLETHTINVSMKGGTPVQFNFDDTGNPIVRNVTAGVGSGFTITGDDLDPASFTIGTISVM